MSTTAAPAPRNVVIPEDAARPRGLRAGGVGDQRVVLLTVLAIAVAYVGWRLGRGWIPLDDGALGHSAERVLRGELPHRDFDDAYTGGLAYLNAAAFRLLGTTLWSLRVVLLAVFVAWVPAVFYIASRFVRPGAAGLATLLAVAWSVPNYPAAMPSWYNRFFATFGVAALLRYLEDARRRWLLAAGLAGGLSFLVKIVGAYYIAGALLFFVFQAHAESRSAATANGHHGRAYALAVTAAMSMFVVTLVLIVRHRLYAAEVAHFVLPGTLVAAFLIWNEWAVASGTSRARFLAMARLLGPFILGVTIPVVIFLVPYLASNALGALVNGVFVLPTKRFGFAEHRMLSLWTIVAVVPLVAVVGCGLIPRLRVARWWAVLLAVCVTLLFLASLGSDAAYRVVWYSARNLPLIVVGASIATLAHDRPGDTAAARQRARIVLLAAVTAVCSLVQFPYAAANYFCYIAPLVVLTAAALLPAVPRLTAAVPLALALLYAAFAVARVNGSPLFQMGERYLAPLPSEPLAMSRAGIDIPSYQAPVYRALIATLRQRARGGYTWASPDCPEIYFLSGLENPTRSLYDFFDDQNDRDARVLAALDARGVTAVVLNRLPPFSAPLTSKRELVAALEQRFPFAADFGPFQLRWRS